MPSLLIGNQDNNQASKKITDQKENKRTNSPYDSVSRLSPRAAVDRWIECSIQQ